MNNCSCDYNEKARVFFPSFNLGGGAGDFTDPLGALTDGTEMSSLVRRLAADTPSFLSSTPVEITSIDFPLVGSLGQLLAVAMYVQSIGENTPAVAASALGVSTILSRALALGFIIKWSLINEQRSAFEMTIATAGFVSNDVVYGEAAQVDVNRSMVLRVEGDCPGGSIYVPFAYDRAGSVPEGRMKAGRSVALLAADPAAGAQIDWANGTATVTITGVPAGITSFGFTVKLMTAHDPDTASFLRKVGLIAS